MLDTKGFTQTSEHMGCYTAVLAYTILNRNGLTRILAILHPHFTILYFVDGVAPNKFIDDYVSLTMSAMLTVRALSFVCDQLDATRLALSCDQV